MFTKLSFRNAFSLALIVLFSTIYLFPINLSAEHHIDHDNISIHGVDAQTMTSLRYSHPYVYSGSYATIYNASNIPVRYYWSDQLAVYREGSQIPFDSVSDSDMGSVDPGGWISFLPWFTIDMTDARKGKTYVAYSDVRLGLKFDFNGDNQWDDGRSVSSSAWLKFDVE